MASKIMGLLLTHQEVFGSPPKREVLKRRLARLSKSDVLQCLGKLSRAIDEQASPADIRIDQEVVSWMKGGRGRAEQLLTHGRRAVHPPLLCTTAREALFHCADREPDNFGDGRDRHLLVESMLAIADLYEGGALADDPTGSERIDSETSLWIKISGPPHPLLRNAIPRYHRLFVDLPAAEPSVIADGIDFDARFREHLGVSVGRYLAIAFAVYTRYGTWDGDPGHWPINHDYLSTTNITLAEFRGALSELAATGDELRANYEREIREGRSSLYDHFPLHWHPLCEVTNGVFIPIDYPSLGGTLVGDGVFWRLRNFFRRTPEEASAFGSSVGQLLERHCMDVATSALSAPTRVYGEVKYDGEHLGPDIAIVEQQGTVLLELGIDRPHLRNTVFSGDIASFDRDVETYLVDRARQLDNKIRAAREGTLVYTDQTADSLGRIYPVISLLDGWPIAPGVRPRIERVLGIDGLLEMEGLGRLAIISVEEFEFLCALAETRGASICELLERHAADNWPLRVRIGEEFGEQPMSRFIAGEYHRVMDVLGDELGMRPADPLQTPRRYRSETAPPRGAARRP